MNSSKCKICSLSLFKGLTFLAMSPDDIDGAVKRLEHYFECKIDCPEFFKNRDVHSEGAQQALKTVNYALLPPISDTCFLSHLSLALFDSKLYNFAEASKIFIMVAGLQKQKLV